mmetsp:Transcript_18559/g.25818  ORF Transcript_18559/g.25818 Transcript_18559/m.25818 type:complete len:534 (+) Transcript_18559:111-1712(+)|eukprot:CAMPEP_0184478190 /NCGR_PEP_ID=MMETSP0113_2-20130426/278_1 /TAXON_ID=91329 /ORGANISM="Norrisiella sphaerica, Strain BC52" /LENGTH=533 /DNA_ID=CAMNT_0026855887 /DNA_START=114 /DNA_END=1715 /DNA_ORIENTATION=+
MSDRRSVKVSFNGDIRKSRISARASVTEVRELLERLFGTDAAYGTKIRYSDEDDDLVLICSDDEVQEAFTQAEQQGKTLKLFVENVKDQDAKRKKSAPGPAPVKAEPSLEQPKKEKTAPASPQSEDFYVVPPQEDKKAKNAAQSSGKSEGDAKARNAEKHAYKARKAAAKEERRAEKAAAKEERRAEKAARNAEKAAEKLARKKEERQERCNESKRQSGRDERKGRSGCHGRGWRNQWREQRAEAKSKFLEDVKEFLSDEEVIKALQETLPIVADKLVKGEEDLKTILDSALEIQPVLKNHKLVQQFLPLVHTFIGFVPLQIVGPIVLDVVLDLQHMLKEGKLDMPVPRLIKRILRMVKRSAKDLAPQVHHGVVCDKCESGSGPIIGNRWKLGIDDANYDLCDKHYEELDEESKEMYHKVDPHNWRPPSAFGIPGFHPGPFAFMNLFGNAYGNGCGAGFNPFCPPRGNQWGHQWGGQPHRGPRGPRGHHHGRHRGQHQGCPWQQQQQRQTNASTDEPACDSDTNPGCKKEFED